MKCGDKLGVHSEFLPTVIKQTSAFPLLNGTKTELSVFEIIV